MKKEQIEYVVDQIMINDGPDGHCDGSDIITNFVMALLEGKEKEWVEKYNNKNLGDDFKNQIHVL